MTRYGLTPERYEAKLTMMMEAAGTVNITPTFPVTGSVFGTHVRLFKELHASGAELALHGLEHIDYSHVTADVLKSHVRQALDLFHEAGMDIRGYRFPYLRKMPGYLQALGETGLNWDSSRVISWDSINPRDFAERDYISYRKILTTYESQDADEAMSLPALKDGFVEIPVSVPDDDILVERLRLKDGELLASIWRQMLNRVRDREEMLVLQVHPERFPNVRHSLISVLAEAAGNGDVWFASLGEIADWWRERAGFSFELNQTAHHRYHVRVRCTDRAAVYVLNPSWPASSAGVGKVALMESRIWDMDSGTKPVIGVSMQASPEMTSFLGSEGFVWEKAPFAGRTSATVNSAGIPNDREKRMILSDIEKCGKPVIRIGRWPYQKRYALAVSGDIDGVDLWDFWRRFHG